MKKTRNSGIWHRSALAALAAILLTAVIFVFPASATDITPEDTFPRTENLTAIEIASYPAKTVYDIGEKLNVAGLKIRLRYNSGRTETIDGDATMCSGFDSSTAGEKSVLVTYRSTSTEMKLSVREISSVSIESVPKKTEYFVGEDLDLDGLKLKISYSAGPDETRDSGYTLIGATRLDTEGTHTVEIEFAGKKVNFTVTVKKATAVSARLTSLPTKTDYMVGDKFDGTGAAFTVTYTDGTTKTVTDGISFSGFSSTAKGEKTVTAKWGDFTEKFTVNVKYASHVHVAGGDREIVKKATCSETGKAVRYCKICGEVAESATLKMLDHTYGEWTVDTAPTANADGEKSRHCTMCGALQTMTLPKLSNVISDGKNGTVTAAGDYLFPSLSTVKIENITSSITAAQLRQLEDIANAADRTIAAVFNVSFLDEDGKNFTPNAKLTYKLVLRAADIKNYSKLKLVYGTKTADATYSGGYITFTVTGTSGVFAIAGVKSDTPVTTPETTPPSPVTTAPEVTTSPIAPVTSSPDDTTPPTPGTTGPEGTTIQPEITRSPETTTSPAPVTTAPDDEPGGSGGAIKTIIIVIVVIVVIGALFELLYIYLKNKLML